MQTSWLGIHFINLGKGTKVKTPLALGCASVTGGTNLFEA